MLSGGCVASWQSACCIWAVWTVKSLPLWPVLRRSLRHVFAVATADALAGDAVLIPIQLAVACLVGLDCFGAVGERRTVLGPGCT